MAPVLALYAAQLKWISKSPAPIQNLRGTIFVPVLLGCLLEQLYMMALYVTLVVLALVLSFKAAALLFLYAILGAQPLSGKLALIFLCRLPAARGFVAQFACGASTILCWSGCGSLLFLPLLVPFKELGCIPKCMSGCMSWKGFKWYILVLYNLYSVMSMLLSSVLAQLQQAFITILLQCYINLESTAHLQLKLLGVLGLAVPANKTPHHEKCSKDGQWTYYSR